MMIDPKAKLIAVVDNAEEYRGLAIRAKERCERQCYERIVELYVEIAEKLEELIDQLAAWTAGKDPSSVIQNRRSSLQRSAPSFNRGAQFLQEARAKMQDSGRWSDVRQR
jgi:hypothetical protein